jgi:hypothetical protein
MRLAWRRIEAQLAAAELRFKPRLFEQLVLLECRRRRSAFRHMAKPQLHLLERRARLVSFEASAGVVRHTCEADYMRWRALMPQAPLAHRMHRKSMVGAGCHPRLATTLEASPILTIVGYPCQRIVAMHLQDLLRLGGLANLTESMARAVLYALPLKFEVDLSKFDAMAMAMADDGGGAGSQPLDTALVAGGGMGLNQEQRSFVSQHASKEEWLVSLWREFGRLRQTAGFAGDRELDELAQPAPLLDVFGAAQDRLYSRLFQS